MSVCIARVEMISKQMRVGDRSAIFGHLAAYLPCSKETLLKRAKSLRAKELEDKIKEPLDKLRQGQLLFKYSLKGCFSYLFSHILGFGKFYFQSKTSFYINAYITNINNT